MEQMPTTRSARKFRAPFGRRIVHARRQRIFIRKVPRLLEQMEINVLFLNNKKEELIVKKCVCYFRKVRITEPDIERRFRNRGMRRCSNHGSSAFTVKAHVPNLRNAYIPSSLFCSRTAQFIVTCRHFLKGKLYAYEYLRRRIV